MNTLGELLVAACTRQRDRVAIIHGTRQLTYGELLDRAGRFAVSLRALGVRPNERVAAFMTDGLESVEVFTDGDLLVGPVIEGVGPEFIRPSPIPFQRKDRFFVDPCKTEFRESSGASADHVAVTRIARGPSPLMTRDEPEPGRTSRRPSSARGVAASASRWLLPNRIRRAGSEDD